MPFAGIGLHIVIALICAVHVVRSGQPLYWLFILFAFPLLGSIVYGVAVYLPNSRLERGAVRAVGTAVRAMDPTKALRLAQADFEHTPTAQNQMRLAAALFDDGQAEASAKRYEAALDGPFASDPDLRFGAARAYVECAGYAAAVVHLEQLRRSRPEYRREAVSLLLARSYAGLSRDAEARHEFESAITTFGTFETYAEFAIWALSTGDTAEAARLQAEMDRMTSRWTAVNRDLNAPVVKRLKAAQARRSV